MTLEIDLFLHARLISAAWHEGQAQEIAEEWFKVPLEWESQGLHSVLSPEVLSLEPESRFLWPPDVSTTLPLSARHKTVS